MSSQAPGAEQLLSRIGQSLGQGDMQAAMQACQLINSQFPGNAEGWYASSIVAHQLGGAQHALSAIDRALGIQPDVAQWLLHRARCLQAGGMTADATRQVRELAAAIPANDSLVAEVGLFASSLAQYDLAKELFSKAIGSNPGNGRLHFNLATVYRFLGEMDAAEVSCNRAIELDPADFDAIFLRSGLRRQKPEQNHVVQLLAALETTRENRIGEALVCYSLAKELEDLEEHARSFEYLQRGASARRGTFNYNVADDIGFIQAITEVYGQEFLQAPADGYRSDAPVFVLGLPRTGTTLVERILSSHDEVTSAGELTHFTRLIADHAQRHSQDPRASREDMVRATARIDFATLGRQYIEITKPLIDGTPLFIDKFPQNSLNVGAIHKALPDARFILLQRHPMDSCYSMYKQLFTDIYHFSYDLSELGRYYIAHQGLMDHWLKHLPENIHVVRYEELVADTEAEARKLVAFCGLEWQEQCLAFERNPQASTTASASQVRQQVYSSSVGKWKCYEQQLEPLRQMLEDAGSL